MSDRLEETVAEFMYRYGLFAGAERILLAVSGGADSTALLHILMALKAQGRIKADLVCAHINHQLRGPASEADEQFVVAEAKRLGLPVVTRAVDVRAHARKLRLSLETAARQLRLASLAEIARERECAWLGTGHQKNDNAETVLQRLLRGTGFRGLAGIWPVRRFADLQLASPLLCATRAEIVQYLQRRALPWREDATNVDVAYTRNRIRHQLLPLLQQEARGCLVEELSELAASATKLNARIEREAQEAWSELVTPTTEEIVFQASGLAALPDLVAVEMIRRAAADLTAGQCEMAEPHYRAVLGLARKRLEGKRVALPRGLIVRYERARLTLSKNRDREGGMVRGTHPALSTVLTVPGQTRLAGQVIEASLLPRSDTDLAKVRRDKGPSTEYLDLDQVKLPVMARTRRAGDRFQPLGMAGEKKVGKFLTTAKATRDLRERILILADREKIVWVYPMRLSERVKVTEKTSRILQLTIRAL